MRVYEYAKKYNLDSKDVLDKLKRNGIELKDHMAFLSPDALAVLRPRRSDNTALGSRAHSSSGQQGGRSHSGPRQSNGQRTSSTQSSSPRPPRPAGGGAPSGFSRGAGGPSRGGAPVAPQKQVGKPSNPFQAKRKDDDSKDDRENFGKKGAASSRAQQENQSQRDFFRQSRETVISEARVELVEVEPDMSLGAVATLMQKPASELIFVLLKKGLLRNLNNVLSVAEVEILGEAFGILVSEKKSEKKQAAETQVPRPQGGKEERLPVVVVMGHVDHGKTTLLDYLRKTNVVAREKGGITQHLGAYEVVTAKNKKMIFLDTPGHEAFSYMRTRGTRITDIAIIIVAANDGIKPQTVEAINLAKQANVPIVVAINKIDKLDSEAQLDTIRTQLSQLDLTPEEWGGQTVCMPISAKTGEGVDSLLDMLSLHSEMLDLSTDLAASARAFVLETKQIKGQGWAVTVIGSQGILRRGDYFVSGTATGRVRLLIDSFGNHVAEVHPSVPVQVVGFDTITGLGDYLEVVSQHEYNNVRSHKEFKAQGLAVGSIGLAEHADTPTVRVLCKADMQGSAQAVIEALQKMADSKRNASVRLELLGCDVGPITEGDVSRAADAGAHLFGLHTRAERNAQLLAKDRGVEIYTHTIIYHMFEQIEDLVKKERQKIVHLVEAGSAEVLKIFPIKNRKVIAGCMIHQGAIKPGDKVVCMRARQEVGSGIVTTLQRDKKEAKKVQEGNDCGFLTDTFHDWQPGDKVVIFSHEQEKD